MTQLGRRARPAIIGVAMHRLAGRAIFSVGDHVFSWEDVVLAAYLWGQMPALQRRVGQGLAAQKRLADVGRPISDDDVEEGASLWRYERDLISGDDTESWLSARELGVEEWLDYFRRSESAKRCSDESRKIAKRYAPSSAEIDTVIFAEAMCSGTTGELAEKLAGRAAISDRVATERRVPSVPAQAKVQTALDRLPRAVRERGLFGLRPAECRKRAESIAAMSLVFDRFVKALGAPKSVDREIESHALEWTRLRCKALRFNAEEPAREAALLMREDGLPIADAAAMAKSKVFDVDYVLEDVGAPLKDRLVAAQSGDVVGPVHFEDGFMVASVTSRVEPSTDEPRVRERARDRVLRRTVQAEIDKRVRWHERF